MQGGYTPNGLLTGLKQGEMASKRSMRGWKIGVGAELPLLAGAKLDVAREPSESGSETMERSYDPFWTNALTFLDFLTEHGLVQTDIEEAALGQLVLIKGELTVLDLAIFKEAWGLKTVQQAVKAGQPSSGNNNKTGRPSGPKMPNEADILLELLGVLPHSVHASLEAENNTIWAALHDEFLVTPASEIVLTHGWRMPGEWAMIGILNARPDLGANDFQQRLAAITADLPAGLMNSAIGQMAKVLAPMIRMALGRPLNAYAVTPLLVFREVT